MSAGDRLPINTVSKPSFGELGSYSDGFFTGWLYGDGWVTERGDNHKTQVGVIVSEKDAALMTLKQFKEKYSGL